MESAFGIDHGEVSKSYNKLAPKLHRALDTLPEYEHQNMKQRLKYNALFLRGVAGNSGKYNKTPANAEYAEFNQGWKKMGQASVRGHESMTRRTRRLP